MRWFCVAPALPNKAVLRIRTAPNSDADVCGRFSKGKAVAAFANVVDIRDDSDPDSTPQKWLHVAFQDEHTGRWSQGYVMASLPDGMTLLVPWEKAGFIRCCNIDEARAILYDSAAMNAQIVGTVDAGEGTRFAYGVAEAAGHRLRIFHDVYDSVWVNADDADTVCEKIDHPNCTVPHSYFTLNEALPAEAQIAIRAFPSREAETVALLSRGQVVEAQARCGNWLQVVGADGQDAWIMWQTNTLQLLTELPFHTAGGCQLTTTAAVERAMEVDLPEQAPPDESEPVDEAAVADEETEREANAAQIAEQRPSLAAEDPSLSSDKDVNGSAYVNGVAASEAQPAMEVQKSPVTNLCDELASNGISSLDEVLKEAPISETTTNGSEAWDERPLNGSRQQEDLEVTELPNSPQDVAQVEDAVEEVVEEAVAEPVVELPAPTPASSSWEDRPISTKGQGSYSYQFDDEAAFPAAQVQAKDPSFSWEDRPIAAKNSGAYNWEASLGEAEGERGQPESISDSPRDEEPLPVQAQSSTPDSVDACEDDAQAQEAQPQADDVDNIEGDPQTAGEQEDGDEAPSSSTTPGSSKVDVVSWDDIPIKSRHVQEAASHLEADGSPLKLTPSKRALDAAERRWNTSARRTPLTRRDETIDPASADAHGNGSASSPETSSRPLHPAVGVVAEDNGSVAWHSNDATEDPDAFGTSDDVEGDDASHSVQHSPRMSHPSHSAVGVVSSDNAVSWHSIDAVEGSEASMSAPNGLLGDGDGIDNTAPTDEVLPIEIDEEREHQDESTHEVMEDDSGLIQVHDEFVVEEADVQGIQEDDDEEMKTSEVAFDHTRLDEEDVVMTGEGPLHASTAVEDESTMGNGEFEEDEEKSETVDAEDELAEPIAGSVGIHSRLMVRLAGLAGGRQDRLLAAIAFNEGPDAILEALASADNYDEDLLKCTPPIGPPSAVAPSPSTSESGLLDVLYSRDQGDGFTTPTKKRPLGGSNQGSARNSYSGVKTEILAGILRRTPQKSRESHNKIVGNANPEEILEAEFGACADELGLFGDYHYPTVAPTRFSSGNFGTPTRAASLSMSSLPSPSLGSAASFSSPVAKENPLKRSASAIAKTPPVNLAKAVAAPKRVESPPPPPPVQVPQKAAAPPKRVLSPPPPPPPPVHVPAPIQVPEKTIPVRSRTPSGLVPPGGKSGIATGLPRPTLVSPSVATSQLRRPGSGALLSPTAGVSRTRSFTTSDDVKQRASLPGAPPPAMARAQSMLPRKSMLPAPSPSKLAAPSPTSRFGLTRSLSSTAPSANTPAAAAATTATTSASLLARRTSFGFSRPTPTKKT